jgi:NADP-dependent 3-hydroxy acid dehydrogenase YdfG
VLDQTALDYVYEKIMAEIGRVDVLINGAGDIEQLAEWTQ